MKKPTHNIKLSHGKKSITRTAICVATAMAIAVPGLASASVVSRVKSRVDAIYNQVRTLRGQTGQMIAGMNKTKNALRSDAIDAIVHSVQPLVQLVRDRQQEYQSFDAEGFRQDFADAIGNIAHMQTMLFGRVGPGISRLEDRIQTANPMLLFALSETPLVKLLEKTQGMDSELTTIMKLTTRAADYVTANYPADQVRRISGLGMSIAAPEYVSCDFVMDNIHAEDIDNLELSRLRAKQISGIAALALKVLPKSQTIGVDVVGGATLSIPNPVTPITATLEDVANSYYEMTENWTKKYSECKQERLNQRLGEFLQAQGYPLVQH